MNEQQLQLAFIQFLAQKTGAKTQLELEAAILLMGEEGLKQAYAEFMQMIQQQQVQAAKFGAKLNYIKSLRGQCPEGYEISYYKVGGTICKKCMKKQQEMKNGGYVPKDPIDEFKCGRKMKKKAQGGGVNLNNGKCKKKEDGGELNSTLNPKSYSKMTLAKCGTKLKEACKGVKLSCLGSKVNSKATGGAVSGKKLCKKAVGGTVSTTLSEKKKINKHQRGGVARIYRANNLEGWGPIFDRNTGDTIGFTSTLGGNTDYEFTFPRYNRNSVYNGPYRDNIVPEDASYSSTSAASTTTSTNTGQTVRRTPVRRIRQRLSIGDNYLNGVGVSAATNNAVQSAAPETLDIQSTELNVTPYTTARMRRLNRRFNRASSGKGFASFFVDPIKRQERLLKRMSTE